MTDRPIKPAVSRTRGSIKEAIGKIIGDTDAIAEGAAEKKAVDPNAPNS